MFGRLKTLLKFCKDDAFCSAEGKYWLVHRHVFGSLIRTIGGMQDMNIIWVFKTYFKKGSGLACGVNQNWITSVFQGIFDNSCFYADIVQYHQTTSPCFYSALKTEQNQQCHDFTLLRDFYI